MLSLHPEHIHSMPDFANPSWNRTTDQGREPYIESCYPSILWQMSILSCHPAACPGPDCCLTVISSTKLFCTEWCNLAQAVIGPYRDSNLLHKMYF